MSSPRSRILMMTAIIVLIAIVGATAAYTFFAVNKGATTSQQTESSSTLGLSSTASTSQASSITSAPETTSIISSQFSQSSSSSTVESSFVTTTSTNNNLSGDWITYHGDLTRDGFDAAKASQTPSFVWKSPHLDGLIYAEPLVYDGMVIVATENNTVYALAESTGSVIWSKNLGEPVPGSSLPCGDISPSGITGTPSIDPAKHELFVVAYLYPSQQHELFALDLSSGRVVFQRNVNPPGVSPLVQQERGALAIFNGMVYIPFGGLDGDCGEYHGFLLGVPENNSGSTISYQDPTGREGGIWAASGPALDPLGNIYIATGNSEATQTFDFGDAVVRLSQTLKEVDYFAPTNWASLNSGDTDLGSVGPMILANTSMIFQIGKEGVGYLLNANNLGQIGGEVFSASVCSGAYGGSAYAASVIYAPCNDGLAALSVNSDSRNFSTLWHGPQFFAGPPIVSGSLVWTVDLDSGDLYALSPINGTTSYTFHLGTVVHFETPASGGGRVFVAAGSVIDAFEA